jgi:hypothetical protein
MKTIYQGLASRTSLRHLKIEFPIDRTPKPSSLIPAMPRLKYLHLTNLDPLCYNDDVSLLLSEAKELEILKLHWNPRMRTEREPSVNLQSYFGRVISSKRTLKLKEIAMANMFCRNESEFGESISFARVSTLTFFNCMNQDDPATIFTDRTWDVQRSPPELVREQLKSVKVIRSDRAGSGFSRVVRLLSDLEEIYLVTHQQCPSDVSNVESPGADQSSNGSVKQHPTVSVTPVEGSNGLIYPQATTPLSPVSSNSPPWHNPILKAKHVVVASDYIAAIVSHHALTLKKLLMPSFWSLGRDVMLHLVTSCPNLEQLAISVDDPSFEIIRTCVRAAPKLEALQLLFPPGSVSPWRDMAAPQIRMHQEVLMLECRKEEYNNIRWLGLGDQTFELCGMRANTGGPGYRRDVRHVHPDDQRLKRVEIFGLNNMDI